MVDATGYPRICHDKEDSIPTVDPFVGILREILFCLYRLSLSIIISRQYALDRLTHLRFEDKFHLHRLKNIHIPHVIFSGVIPRLLSEALTIWLANTMSHVINTYVLKDRVRP